MRSARTGFPAGVWATRRNREMRQRHLRWPVSGLAGALRRLPRRAVAARTQWLSMDEAGFARVCAVGFRTNACGCASSPSQARCCGAHPVAVDGRSGIRTRLCGIRPLTVAGAAQVGESRAALRFLLPVELRHANHTAGTNVLILDRNLSQNPTMTRMSAGQIDQIAERVERLLVRYEELQRTNALLTQQV